ncbi:hypothetical protein ACTMTF_47680 [Nonomuraea sp. ZG12]|uniref:hypothetical protein n=1 Tax=Nonomuraea sp. ZG12 TaxID=3452207 RepID=UPI003F898FA1
MSKTMPEVGRATGSRLWRGMAIIVLVVLAASLVAGVLGFVYDPFNLPPKLLETLDQRASVIGMFSGMLLGVAGLVVAMVALRAQRHADRIAAGIAPPETAAAEQQAIQVATEGERSVPVPADAPDDTAPQPGDTDGPSIGTGKYVVDVRYAQAVQVGEHLTQRNVFHSPPTQPDPAGTRPNGPAAHS